MDDGQSTKATCWRVQRLGGRWCLRDPTFVKFEKKSSNHVAHSCKDWALKTMTWLADLATLRKAFNFPLDAPRIV